MNSVRANQFELDEALSELKRMERAIDRKSVNAAQRRNARPMLRDMKENSPSHRIADMTSITTRQTKRPRAPGVGIRIGVINNSASRFPDFSAPALASVLEYGTEERFQKLKRGGVIVGKSTGAMPDKHRWLRLAWDRNVQQFVAKTEESYRKLIEK